MLSFEFMLFIFGSLFLWLFYGQKRTKKLCRKVNDFSDKSYIKVPVNTPRLSGQLLKLGTWFLETKIGSLMLGNHLYKNGGLGYFKKIELEDQAIFYPNHPAVVDASNVDEHEGEKTEDFETVSSPFTSIQVLQSAYKSRTVTPLDVAKKALDAVKKDQLNIFVRYDSKLVLEEAEASTKRYADNEPLSAIDGMIVGIKDEFRVKGLKCTTGMSYPAEPCKEDSTIVEKLRSLGAIILGVTNMHEIGMGTTGINTNKGFGACRNPYNKRHITGGSSSGSAAAVASGICTFSIGTDGGGSIRLPASFCGLVGLKATFGRYTMGNADPGAYTVTHSGALCSNVADASLVYSLLAGPTDTYRVGSYQPKPKVSCSKPLKEMKICYDDRWFKDCDSEVYETCRKARDVLSGLVSSVESIEIAELHDVLAAHRIIISGEMVAGMKHVMRDNPSQISYPTRALLCGTSLITCSDYFAASQQRGRTIAQLKQIFDDYDAIITPTTACIAVQINDDELDVGYLDAAETVEIMKYAPIGNLTGIPGITVPVGYSIKEGLPIGFQIMSKWWTEEICLTIAQALESKYPKKAPEHFVQILPTV